MVEHGQSSHGKKKVHPGKGSKLGSKVGIFKKSKFQFQGKCYNCDKTEHRASECRLPQKKFKKNQEANMIELDPISRDVSNINLSVVVSEVNLVGSNPKEWWIDTSATRQICSDKAMFTSFEPMTNGEKMFMGNSAVLDVEG